MHGREGLAFLTIPHYLLHFSSPVSPHLYTTQKNSVEERLEEYSQRFDVVLLGDGDLSYVIALLNEVVGEENGGNGGKSA